MKKLFTLVLFLSILASQAQPGGKMTSTEARAVAQVFAQRYDARWVASNVTIERGQLKEFRLFTRDCADRLKKIDASACPAAFQTAWSDYVAKAAQLAGAGRGTDASVTLAIPAGGMSPKGLSEILQHTEPEETRAAWQKVESVIADLGLTRELLNAVIAAHP